MVFFPCSNAWRTTSAEKRELERLGSDLINNVRRAAEVHRQVRKWAQTWIKPGIKLIGASVVLVKVDFC